MQFPLGTFFVLWALGVCGSSKSVSIRLGMTREMGGQYFTV